MVLDGRKRMAEYESRGLSAQYPLPRLVVRSHLDALKHLLHAGHHDRAADHALRYAPEFVDKSTDYLTSAFEMTRHKLIPYIQALQPEERHKLPRRAMSVVKKVKQLENVLRTEGRKATADELLSCIEEFVRE